jgi:hypothetical protein
MVDNTSFQMHVLMVWLDEIETLLVVAKGGGGGT